MVAENYISYTCFLVVVLANLNENQVGFQMKYSSINFVSIGEETYGGIAILAVRDLKI